MSYKKENRNHQFEFIKIPLKEMKFIDLSDAKAIIDQLNKQWNCKNYYIGLDYWFDLKENSKIVNYCWINHDRNNLILGIFTTENNNCVSSTEIIFGGDNGEDEVEPYCVTHPTYRRKNMNALLYAVLVMVAKKINNQTTTILVVSVSPYTTHVIYTYFDIQKNGRADNIVINVANDYKARILFNDIINNKFKCDHVPNVDDTIIVSGGKRIKYKMKLCNNINQKKIKYYKTKKRGKTLYKRSKISKNY